MDISLPLKRFLYFKCGNEKKAEDVMQDAFVKLWENCKKVTPAKAKSYLYTVANNLFLNEVAHDKVVLKYLERQPSYKADQVTPEYELEKKEFRERLQMAINNLPEKQRIVFLMNRIDKKKYREIADDLGINIKTVENRMHLALKTLRKIHKKI